jgi:hypothetical protein
MIIFDILDILLQTSITLAGYSIFAPGEGANSGKLTFKSLIAGTGISIFQGTSSIQIQDDNSALNLGILQNRVARGTSTGITGSSILRVSYCGFAKVNILSYEDPNTVCLNDCSAFERGLIVGGCLNRIYQSGDYCANVILGGLRNRIGYTSGPYSCNNIISNSYCSEIFGYGNNTILSTCRSRIIRATSNVIIGGSGSCIDGTSGGSVNNTIINSSAHINSADGYTLIGTSVQGSIYQSTQLSFSSLISSNSTCVQYNKFSTIIASSKPLICANAVAKSSYNTMLSTYNSCIVGYGDQISRNNFTSGCGSKLLNSCYSSIISSPDTQMLCSIGSSILAGSEPRICCSQNSVVISSATDVIENSTISTIIGANNASYICGSTSSLIIGGTTNLIKSSDRATILGGRNNVICSSEGSFISGICNVIGGPVNWKTNHLSSIFGKCNRIIAAATHSFTSQSNFIIGLSCNYIVSGTLSLNWSTSNNSILGTCLNTITQSGSYGGSTDFSNNFINGNINTIRTSRMSAILSSCGSTVSAACGSIIIGSCNSCIGDDDNNAIIGSPGATITGSRRSAIIGTTGSLVGLNDTVKTNLVRINGTITTCVAGATWSGLNYCSISSGATITSLSVRNGIIIAIATL